MWEKTPLQFMTIGGQSGLCLPKITIYVALPWLNKSRLSLLHFSIIFKSLAKMKTSMEYSISAGMVI